MAEKVTIMVLEVDLQCPRCYKKVKKVLCKFPREIRDQEYDEKKNRVTIRVVCCNPERMRDKLCCKGGRSIKSIEIIEQPKSKPPQLQQLPPLPQLQPLPQLPPLPPLPKLPPLPQLPPLPPWYMQGYTTGDCCKECREGYTGGPCFRGCYGGSSVCNSYGGGRSCHTDNDSAWTVEIIYMIILIMMIIIVFLKWNQ